MSVYACVCVNVCVCVGVWVCHVMNVCLLVLFSVCNFRFVVRQMHGMVARRSLLQ